MENLEKKRTDYSKLILLQTLGTVEQYLGGLGGWEKHLKSIFSLMAYLNRYNLFLLSYHEG